MLYKAEKTSLRAAKPQGWPMRPLRGINKTAWCAKLILTADLVCQVRCARLGHAPTDGTALPFVFECLI